MTEDNWGGVLFEEMETKCTWVEGVDSGERFEDAGIIPPQKGPHSHRHFLFSGGKHALFFSFCSFGCQFTVMIKTDNLKSFGAVSLLVHSRMLLSLKKKKTLLLLLVRDTILLQGRKSFIRIHEDASGGIYCVGVTTRPVNSLEDVSLFSL